MLRLYLFLSAAIALMVSDASLAAETKPGLPPYSRAYEPTTVDERGLWMEADERERRVRDSSLRIRDGKLESYLHEVLCRQVGPERCAGVRIYAMEVPMFNASMMANGAMEVWSGLLLRVANEAELAAILGHEFAHFELRHSLNGFKNRRGATDVAAWLSVLGGISNIPVAETQMSLVGSIYRFDRDMETQADLLGLRYLAHAGYPSRSAANVWHSLMAEEDARMAGRMQKAKQKYSVGFFDSHPAPLTRAAYLSKHAAAVPGGTDLRAKEYDAAIAPYLPRFLAAQIKLNDFGGSDYILQSLSARSGWTGDLLFARAELFRGRGHPRDLQQASHYYKEARAAGHSAPELERNLGLVLIRNGQLEEGRAALVAYLKAHPAANDAKIINSLLAN